VEGVAGDAEGQVLAVGVDLGDAEGLGKVAKGRRVQLDAVDRKGVLVGSYFEVEQLCTCQ
jgi:hypothetical protein